MIPLFVTVTAIQSTRRSLYWTKKKKKKKNFRDISGLKLNPSKTKALWLGSWRHRQDKPFGFHWPEKLIRVLGTFISYNEKENEKYNFTLKFQKLKTIFDIFSVFISHVIKTKNRNRSINKFKNLGYDR